MTPQGAPNNPVGAWGAGRAACRAGAGLVSSSSGCSEKSFREQTAISTCLQVIKYFFMSRGNKGIYLISWGSSRMMLGEGARLGGSAPQNHTHYCEIYLCRGQGQVERLLLRVKVHPCDGPKGMMRNVLCPCSPLGSCLCPLASLAPLTPGGGGSMHPSRKLPTVLLG